MHIDNLRMKLFFNMGAAIGLLLLAASLAHAESESVLKSPVRAEPSGSPYGFHGITYFCKSDEAEELETTPQSPPLNIDDPATPGCNNWEINVILDADITQQERNWELPLLDINYGIGDNVQLKYEVPNTVQNTADSQTNAVGYSRLGVKYQFYGEDETKLQYAVYPQVQFMAPGISLGQHTGDTSGTIVTLPVLMARRVGRTFLADVTLSMNLGYNISSIADTADYVSAAAGIGVALFKKVSLLSEIASEQAVRSVGDATREQLLKVNVGLMSPVGKHFIVFGSVGKSLSASDERDHLYVLSGIRLLADGQ